MNALQASPTITNSVLSPVRPKSEPIASPQSPEGAVEPKDSIETHSTLYKISSKAVSALSGAATGLALGVTRVIIGGCAGAAQGVVHGIKVDEDPAGLPFKATMAANLAVSGAIGGVTGLDWLSLSPSEGALTGAATNVIVGNSEWDRAPGTFHDTVRANATTWLDQTLAQMPDSITQGEGTLGKVARGTIGEVVGLASGVYTGVVMMGHNYNSGFQWGTKTFDKVVDYFENKGPAPKFFTDAPSSPTV